MFELADIGYTDSDLGMCTGQFVGHFQEIHFLEYMIYIYIYYIYLFTEIEFSPGSSGNPVAVYKYFTTCIRQLAHSTCLQRL
jgi:hypothetical protein